MPFYARVASIDAGALSLQRRFHRWLMLPTLMSSRLKSKSPAGGLSHVYTAHVTIEQDLVESIITWLHIILFTFPQCIPFNMLQGLCAAKSACAILHLLLLDSLLGDLLDWMIIIRVAWCVLLGWRCVLLKALVVLSESKRVVLLGSSHAA